MASYIVVGGPSTALVGKTTRSVYLGDQVSDLTDDIAALLAVGVQLVLVPNAEIEAWAANARAIRKGGGVPYAPPFTSAETTRRALQFAPEGGGWNDVNSGMIGVPAGGSAPNYTVLPGMTAIAAYGFQGTGALTERLNGTFEVMHGYKTGTAVYPHFHYATDAVGGGGNIRLTFTYVIAPFDVEATAETVVTVDTAPSGLGANGRPIVRVLEPVPAGISGSNVVVGAQIRWQVSRRAADAADTYTGMFYLVEVGMHYQSDTEGSSGKFAK